MGFVGPPHQWSWLGWIILVIWNIVEMLKVMGTVWLSPWKASFIKGDKSEESSQTHDEILNPLYTLWEKALRRGQAPLD